MSLGGWVVTLLVLLVLLVLVGRILVVRRPPATEAHALVAEPDDRPLAAVVVNPVKIADAERGPIEDICATLGWAPPLWLETSVEDPGTGQALAAMKRGADVVLACGGDGTVRAVAAALAGTGVAMGLLPAGTGNLLARTLGTPLELGAATRVALTGDDRSIDVGRLRVDADPQEQTFLVMCGTGFDAAIMANTPEILKVRVGPLAYVISGLRAMRGHRTRVTLRFDGGEPLRRRSRTVVVGNSGTLPGGLLLMPGATVDDGLLDVVNISPKSFAGWLAVGIRITTRRRHGHRRVEHWQAGAVEIAAEEPQPAQIDGDPIGEVTRLLMRIERRVLVVRVPG